MKLTERGGLASSERNVLREETILFRIVFCGCPPSGYVLELLRESAGPSFFTSGEQHCNPSPVHHSSVHQSEERKKPLFAQVLGERTLAGVVEISPSCEANHGPIELRIADCPVAGA
ncbi:MAG TPA: hypothetical protein VGQ12_06155 [Candidatus Angelobacter sp.]|nr:hypothetical protein [Candidatus Angelobacter sp.]